MKFMVNKVTTMLFALWLIYVLSIFEGGIMMFLYNFIYPDITQSYGYSLLLIGLGFLFIMGGYILYRFVLKRFKIKEDMELLKGYFIGLLSFHIVEAAYHLVTNIYKGHSDSYSLINFPIFIVINMTLLMLIYQKMKNKHILLNHLVDAYIISLLPMIVNLFFIFFPKFVPSTMMIDSKVVFFDVVLLAILITLLLKYKKHILESFRAMIVVVEINALVFLGYIFVANMISNTFNNQGVVISNYNVVYSYQMKFFMISTFVYLALFIGSYIFQSTNIKKGLTTN